MAVDRELLKEVTQELWNTVKKLRPEIDRQTRLQLVLKALLTIGDLPDQMQAAMVVGVCAEMDKSDVDNIEANSIITSLFKDLPVPKNPEELTSIINITISSRSSSYFFIKGLPVRAVTFQSIARISSPG